MHLRLITILVLYFYCTRIEARNQFSSDCKESANRLPDSARHSRYTNHERRFLEFNYTMASLKSIEISDTIVKIERKSNILWNPLYAQ